MSINKWLIIVLISVIYFVNGRDLPDNFQKCKRSNANLDECLKNAIQDALPKLSNGLPDFNFPSIQPLEVPKIVIGEGKGVVNVVQNFKNVKIYNIPLAQITKVKASLNSTHAQLDIDSTIDEIIFASEYDFNGRVLLLPIVGSGNSSIVFKGVKSQLSMSCEEFKKKGTGYLDVKELKLQIKPTKIDFQFDNLFNGDERLTSEMNRLLSENWKDIWNDISNQYEDAISLIFQDLVNKFMKNVPHEKLFPL